MRDRLRKSLLTASTISYIMEIPNFYRAEVNPLCGGAIVIATTEVSVIVHGGNGTKETKVIPT